MVEMGAMRSVMINLQKTVLSILTKRNPTVTRVIDGKHFMLLPYLQENQLVGQMIHLRI